MYISVITGKKVAGNLDILVNEEYRPDSYCRRIAIGRSGSHVEQRNECNRLIYGAGTRAAKTIYRIYPHSDTFARRISGDLRCFHLGKVAGTIKSNGITDLVEQVHHHAQ